MLALAAAVVAAQVAAAPAPAEPDAAFEQALQLVAAGKRAEAADALEALASSRPDAAAAAAVAKAAELREALGQPHRALALYRRLIARYPDSRLVRRARVRARVLQRGLGGSPGDAAAYADYQRIIGGVPRLEQVRRARALVAAHPDAPAADDARMLLGSASRDLGWPDEAVRWYREVARRNPGTPRYYLARKGEADALAAYGRFDAARAVYRELAATGDRRYRLWAEKGVEELDRAQRRSRLAQLAWVVVALVALGLLVSARRQAGSWRGLARRLARPPVEVWYLAPVALVVVLASATSNGMIARAVRFVLIGALALTWLSGATLEAARRRAGRVSWKRAAVHAAGAAAAVVALCYLAMMHDRLLDMVVETWRHGPEP